jgi:nucleoside-diphosphate-sugar epimerase
MYCAISGHTGVLGKHFIKISKKKFKFIKLKGDIRKIKNLERWLDNSKIEAILHFAAIVPTKKVKQNYKKAKAVNTNSVKNILKILKKNKKKVWFFLASSSHVYSFSKSKISEKKKPQPVNKYGLTKLLAEKALTSKKYSKYVNYCIGRIFSYTKPDQDQSFIVPSMFKKKNLKIDDLNHCRDFTHIDDICYAIKILCMSKKKGIFNIGSGNKINLINLYNIVWGSSYPVPKKPKTSHYADIQKIKKIGWSPKNKIIDIIKDFKK